MKTLRPIIITEGDPVGISIELLDKSIAKLKLNSKNRPIIIVSSQDQIESKLYKSIPIISNESEIGQNNLYRFRTSLKEKSKIELGEPSKQSGLCSYYSFQTGMELQKKFKANLITLPLSKEWVIKSGVKDFVGHTEELAKTYNQKTFMLMYGKKLRVIPLTTHVPLIKVPEFLKNLDVLALVNAIKTSILLKGNLRIAICGVNPHAGEDGKIGNEEQEILKPMVRTLLKQGLSITGPISGDSVFLKENLKKYDLIFAAYHDQGLIPFKHIEGNNGVNVTLGLDFIRVSPDHGTAFSIAKSGTADNGSFVQCLNLLKNL